MEVVTHDRMISLGIMAKDHFAEHVLKIDENGKTFDVLQVVTAEMLDKIQTIPIKGAFTQKIKDGAIDAFSRMTIGDKFLCLSAWVTDHKSDEAKFYWKTQKLCNEGYSLAEAQEVAKEEILQLKNNK
jgi:hypothetical protein